MSSATGAARAWPVLALVLACGGQAAALGTRSGDGAGGGGQPGGGSGAGAFAGGTVSAGQGGAHVAAGAAGSSGTSGIAGGPAATRTTLVQRPGRPSNLVVDGDRLSWILTVATSDHGGAVESVGLGGGDIRTVFPADPPIFAYSSLPTESFVYAAPSYPVREVRRADKVTGLVETVLADEEVTAELVVVGDFVYRGVYGTHNESYVQRVTLSTGSALRVSQNAQPDAYLGALRFDGADLLWSTQAFGADSGLYRCPLGGAAQIFVAAGADDLFSASEGEIFRVRRDGDDAKTFAVDAVDKLSGERRPVLALSGARYLAPPIVSGAHLYQALQPADDEPWQLVRTLRAGGAPALVLEELCPAAAISPSLAAAGGTLYVACAGDGTISALVPPP